MRLNFLLLFSAAALAASCSRPGQAPGVPVGEAPHGQNVGNSGDFIRALFEQGRLQAVQVLTRITPSYLPHYSRESLRPGEESWFFQNKDKIKEDIIHSTHVWTEKLPRAICPYHPTRSCGCTLGSPSTEVRFSYETCKSDATVSEVGQLILHESLHHFLGADEEKVYRIAANVYGAWMSSRMSQFPHLILDPYNPADLYESLNVGESVTAWTGKELFIWNVAAWYQASLFNPATNRWRRETIKPGNAFQSCISRGGADGAFRTHSVAVAKSIVSVPVSETGPECTEPDGKYGIVVDLESNRWNPILSRDAPINLEGLSVAAAGNKAILFAARDTFHLTKWGALYEPATQRWDPIADYEVRKEAEQYSTMLWASNRFILWGRSYTERGPGHAPRTVGDSAGLVYDPATRNWRDMSLEGVPQVALIDSVVLSTGKTIFVYGRKADTETPTGAVFDPVLNAWRAIRLQGSPLPSPDMEAVDAHRAFAAVWDGLRVVVKGKDLRFYYPDKDCWAVSDQELEPLSFVPFTFLFTGLETVLWDPRKLQGLVLVP